LAGPSAKTSADPKPRLRIDRWLWQARFFRSRSFAAAVVAEGHVRINGQPIHKPGREISPGDTLTFPQGNRIRLIRITDLGQRRGPATEAQGLYLDLDPQPDSQPGALPDPETAANPLE
jgi:ribosome-associated heat shock protein Hsp15